MVFINPLKPELNPICYLLALLGAHHFLHVSRIRVKLLTFRLLMSYIYDISRLRVNLTEVFLTLTEVFPCFFLSCKANAKVKLAKTGYGPHSSTLVVICVVLLLFVLFCVLFV